MVEYVKKPLIINCLIIGGAGSSVSFVISPHILYQANRIALLKNLRSPNHRR